MRDFLLVCTIALAILLGINYAVSSQAKEETPIEVGVLTLQEYLDLSLGSKLPKQGFIATNIVSEKYNEVYHTYTLGEAKVQLGIIENNISSIIYEGTTDDIRQLNGSKLSGIIVEGVSYYDVTNEDGSLGFIREWYTDKLTDVKKVIYLTDGAPYEVVFINDIMYEIRKV